ncbi:hypothetical protein RFI_19531 [Reticulomyxa filosa]|uniref:FMR1-interacting protein 1 conserved domain-containing protein n=1 Tax=Reticulomyxa filosa TaxID=46433 RepID=X6MVA3_RETFI|nr:hypothetical protein RFI_19531 [Reticulomyxa filosa]|eukprot:ETO17784.1 hypothetical protein RFI_19531 [Reticulomyxa filosa]
MRSSDPFSFLAKPVPSNSSSVQKEVKKKLKIKRPFQEMEQSDTFVNIKNPVSQATTMQPPTKKNESDKKYLLMEPSTIANRATSSAMVTKTSQSNEKINQTSKANTQKYPNDGGLSDEQYQAILEARKFETPQMIEKYVLERRKNYPTQHYVEKKKQLIETKKKAWPSSNDFGANTTPYTNHVSLAQTNKSTPQTQQEASILSWEVKGGIFHHRYAHARMRGFGNGQTPSIFRFLKPPKYRTDLTRELLSKELNEEYSAVLQCFRYFVQTDFLNMPSALDLQLKKTADTHDETSFAHPILPQNTHAPDINPILPPIGQEYQGVFDDACDEFDENFERELDLQDNMPRKHMQSFVGLGDDVDHNSDEVDAEAARQTDEEDNNEIDNVAEDDQ